MQVLLRVARERHFKTGRGRDKLDQLGREKRSLKTGRRFESFHPDAAVRHASTRVALVGMNLPPGQPPPYRPGAATGLL